MLARLFGSALPMFSGPILSDADSLDVSVIVSTRNRGDKLARTFQSWELIRTGARWELIVVDNGSSDSTASIIAQQVTRGALPLVTVSEQRRGLSYARNTGVRCARGRILCFTDDDCYPDPGFIDAWRGVLTQHGLDFAGGRVELYDPADADVTIKTDQDPVNLAPRRFIQAGSLHGACMAFRREVIAAIGPFDVKLGAGSCLHSAEDSEFFQRASDMGFTGGYRPEPFVFHHHGRKSAEVASLLQGYDVGRGALYVRTVWRNPGCLMRHIQNDFASHASMLNYAKSLYWRQRRRFVQRTWNITRGMLVYAAVFAPRLPFSRDRRRA